MSRVEFPPPADLTIDSQGNVLSGRAVTAKLAGTATNVTHYSALTGGTSTTGGLFTYTDGTIVDGSNNRRYVDSGISMDITISGRTRQVEAVSGVDIGAVGTRNLSGTGSPEGAVSASPGATFQQTNGTEGATFWIKETGTGNTGWRLSRRIFPYDIDLYGPESRAAEAMQAAITATYAFPGSALTSSTTQMLSGLNARVRAAYWNLVWTPNATGCGVELVMADAGPTNIVQMAEFTGNASVTPVNSTVNVTTAMQTVVAITAADVPTGSANKTIGYRTKGNAAVGPLIYVSRVQVLFEA